MSFEQHRKGNSEGAVGLRADFIRKVPQANSILDELNQSVDHLFIKNGEAPNIRHATAIQKFIFGIRLGVDMNQMDASYPDLVLYSDPTHTLASQADVGIMLNIAKLVEKTKGRGNWVEVKKGKELRYRGSIDNYFILAGVEEASHVKYEEQDSMGTGLDPMNTSLTQYDAQPHEFIALQQKLEIAERLMMDSQTVEVLRSRIDNARKLLSDS